MTFGIGLLHIFAHIAYMKISMLHMLLAEFKCDGFTVDGFVAAISM